MNTPPREKRRTGQPDAYSDLTTGGGGFQLADLTGLVVAMILVGLWGAWLAWML